jgi:hypothetical protein
VYQLYLGPAKALVTNWLPKLFRISKGTQRGDEPPYTVIHNDDTYAAEREFFRRSVTVTSMSPAVIMATA